ncbi:MAG TPA: hypothetical protein DEQ02_08070 [Ruminococcaceae bacterium]|nr:hypothetical protein [Oscillospiraceae bacterium]
MYKPGYSLALTEENIEKAKKAIKGLAGLNEREWEYVQYCVTSQFELLSDKQRKKNILNINEDALNALKLGGLIHFSKELCDPQ